MSIETRRPLNSWECYTPDMAFLTCGSCAWKFAESCGIELTNGLHTYGEEPNGYGVSECYACGHEFDTVPSCDTCGEYLQGYLLPDAIEALKQEDYPQWLKDHYLSNI